MDILKTLKLISLTLIFFLFSACEDKREVSYMANVPVYMSYEEFRTNLVSTAGRELESPGKIYLYNDYLLINEINEGIHIIDNSNPSDPRNIAFIVIPGNVDMAITGDYLYADSYMDLVLFDISTITSPVFHKRIEKFFCYQYPPYDYNYPVEEIDTEKGVIIDWEIKRIKKEEPNYPPMPIYYYPWSSYAVLESSSRPWGINYAGKVNVSVSGSGGSMAKFIVYNNYLYMLDEYDLKIVDITNPDEPLGIGSNYIGWGMETVFIADDYMYIGTREGMHILNLAISGNPTLLSTYYHIFSCDPVIVDGDYAYVTLRSGNNCGQNSNRLDVVNILDKVNPSLFRSFDLTEPYGLGKDGNLLFICEGNNGLNIFDASNINFITSNKIKNISNIIAYDVIAYNGLLMVIGETGLSQYDYSDPGNIEFLSSIPITESIND
jgi:hypothetical protein